MGIGALNLVDLFIGDDYADYTTNSGHNAARAAVPEEFAHDIDVLRTRCYALRKERDEDEFSVTYDGDLYRVTAFADVVNGHTFFLSRGTASILAIGKLGMPAHIRELLLDPATTGMVVFCGPRGSGKTTSASSVLSARLRKTGGVALALQDPIETNLHGMHGDGRCIQSPVSRRYGGYRDAMVRAMRTRVNTLLLGEIREEGTAGLAVNSGQSGIFLLATQHADPKQAHNIRSSLGRLLTMAAEDIGHDRAAINLAESLTVLVQQRLVPVSAGSSTMRAELSCLNFNDPKDGPALRSLVSEQKLDQIQTIAEAQAKRALFEK